MTSLNKPVTRRISAIVPHGVKPEIVVTLYPGGTIGLRESGRRKKAEYFIDVGSLYVRAVQNKIAFNRMQKAKARSTERKLRKKLR
jgi:hypothetical protein